MKESNIEKYLKQRVEAIGGLCWKFVSPGTVGVPDRIVIIDGGVIFVELKSPNGKLSEIQQKRIKQIHDQGCDACVLSSLSDVDRFVGNLAEGMVDEL